MAIGFSTRVLSVVLACAPIACAHGGGAGTGGAGDDGGPVALKFAWPEGFKTHVLIAHQTRRRGAEPTAILAHQRMTTEKKGGELWVVTKDTAARGNDPDLETTIKVNEALVQVVGPDGRFVRAEGVEQALSALKPNEREDRDNTRRALARSAQSDWDLMVGGWAGQTLRLDAPSTRKLRTSVPLFAAAETTMESEYVYEGRVPCTDAEKTRNCVALTYRGHIAPDDRAATLDQFRKVGGFKPDDPVPEDVHAEMEVQLVTEPETLVPHRMTQLQRLRVRMRFPDGRVQEADERSEDVSIFTDKPPGPGPTPGPGPDAPANREPRPPSQPGAPEKGQSL